MREKVGKSRNTVFFQWFGAPEGRKVGSLKRRVRSQLARWEIKIARRCGAKHMCKSKCTKHTTFGPLLEVAMSKKCTPLWREAHLQVKMYKTPQLRTTFGSCDVEKVHAVVARSAFPSQNAQSTPLSDHFWKLSCGKSARRCGAKHISKSKCTKHHMFAPLLEVRMLKSARRCGAKHMSKSKCTKHHMFAPLLEVRMLKKCTARSRFRSQNVQSTTCSRHFWRFGCRFASLHYTTLHYTTLHYTTLHYTTLHYTTLHYNYNYTPLHSTTLHYTPLHSTTLHYTTLHYTTLHSTTLHYITLHYLPLHFTTLHYTTPTTTTTTTQLHSTTRNYTTLHYITLHYTTFHYTPLHYITLQYTEWRCTTDRQVDR